MGQSTLLSPASHSIKSSCLPSFYWLACWPLPLRGPTMAMMGMEITEAMEATDTADMAMVDTAMVDMVMVDMDTGILTTVDTAAMGTATITGMDMDTDTAMEDMGYTRGALITSRFT